MELEEILNTLIKDMIEKGIVPKGTDLNSITRFELAETLLINYMHYPLPSKSKAFFPFNYCMLT